MSEFLWQVARRTLLDLRGRFEEFDRRMPHVRHGMIEAPLRRRSDAEVTHTIFDMRSGVAKYRDDGPPVRVHYYFDGDEGSGEVGEFQGLARAAGICLAGWPREIIEPLGVCVGPVGLRRYREPEYWMSVVHRLAWRAPQGSPLQAIPSVPDDNWRGDVEYPEGVEVVVPAWRASRDRYHFELSIPPDYMLSMLSGFGVGRCSVYAVDIALAALDKVYPSPPIEAAETVVGTGAEMHPGDQTAPADPTEDPWIIIDTKRSRVTINGVIHKEDRRDIVAFLAALSQAKPTCYTPSSLMVKTYNILDSKNPSRLSKTINKKYEDLVENSNAGYRLKPR